MVFYAEQMLTTMFRHTLNLPPYAETTKQPNMNLSWFTARIFVNRTACNYVYKHSMYKNADWNSTSKKKNAEKMHPYQNKSKSNATHMLKTSTARINQYNSNNHWVGLQKNVQPSADSLPSSRGLATLMDADMGIKVV